jgi:putative endonuclease
MSSGFLGTLYIGVTSDLVKRAYQHKTGFYKGFTDKYAVNQLVYYELHDSMEQAITREKQMKKWNRKWKVNLISSVNPEWRDLYDTIVD